MVAERLVIRDCGHYVRPDARERTCTHPGCGFSFCDEDCANVHDCEHCGNATTCADHTHEHEERGNRWKICFACRDEREKDLAAERAAVESITPAVESLLAKMPGMGAHDVYEELQRLSVQLLRAA